MHVNGMDLHLRPQSFFQTNTAVAAALYRQAQEHIADHALSIGVYDRLSTLAVGPHVDGIRQENSQGGPVFHDAHLVD